MERGRGAALLTPQAGAAGLEARTWWRASCAINRVRLVSDPKIEQFARVSLRCVSKWCSCPIMYPMPGYTFSLQLGLVRGGCRKQPL